MGLFDPMTVSARDTTVISERRRLAVNSLPRASSWFLQNARVQLSGPNPRRTMQNDLSKRYGPQLPSFGHRDLRCSSEL